MKREGDLLDPQAALEEAAAELLRKAHNWTPAQCKRMFDGTPPPLHGHFFVAVWSDNARQTDGQRTQLTEYFQVLVTISVRLDATPFDRWVQRRDEL